jgi:AraC-like DNA-binding protein
LNDPLYRELELRKEYPFGGCQIIKLYLEFLLIEFIRKGVFAEHYKSPTAIEHNLSSNNVYTGIVTYIENNLTKRLTISDICRVSTVNRSSLELIFKKHSGMSIIQFYRYKKVDKAKQLIRQGGLNLTQISDLLGFDSLHYFSRTFKQITGMTPTEYAVSTKAMIDHSLEVSQKNADL